MDLEPHAFSGAGTAPQYREEQPSGRPFPASTAADQDRADGTGLRRAWLGSVPLGGDSEPEYAPAAINTTPMTIATARLLIQAVMARP